MHSINPKPKTNHPSTDTKIKLGSTAVDDIAMIMRKPHSFDRLVNTSSIKELEKFDAYTTEIRKSQHGETKNFNWDELQRVSHLGSGAFCTVSLVITDSRDQLALKCLNPKKFKSPDEFVDAAADLAREADTLSKLDHENIIRLRGVPTTNLSQSYTNCDDVGYFILLDTLDETLQKRLSRWRREASLEGGKTEPRLKRALSLGSWKATKKKVPKIDLGEMLDRVKSVAVGAARGMKYLHEQDIIMKDLNPSNIGFDQDTGEVRIFDFGLARKLDSKFDRREKERGIVCGTPRYMAPEVMRGQGSLKASDVFSFGVLLYEVCSLQTPYDKVISLENFQKRVISGERPSLDPIPCQDTRDLIAQCWAAEPQDRFSFDQICTQLSKITIADDTETYRA
jgi:serine/threonine protein kinase